MGNVNKLDDIFSCWINLINMMIYAIKIKLIKSVLFPLVGTINDIINKNFNDFLKNKAIFTLHILFPL